MNRPAGMAERRSASEARRIAAVRAALAARRAEQAAAARRRLVLTLVALAVTVLAWVAVAAVNFEWYLALFPTLVLGATLYLGVRAAQAERTEWAAVPESLRSPRTAAPAGPSFSPSQLRAHLTATGAPADASGSGLRWGTDEVRVDTARVVEEGGAAEVQAEPLSRAVPAPGTWTPVPVPVPTYTLKASAVRRETGVVDPVMSDDAVEPVPVSQTPEAPGPVGSTEAVPSIDLNAVLARRRAV